MRVLTGYSIKKCCVFYTLYKMLICSGQTNEVEIFGICSTNNKEGKYIQHSDKNIKEIGTALGNRRQTVYSKLACVIGLGSIVDMLVNFINSSETFLYLILNKCSGSWG